MEELIVEILKRGGIGVLPTDTLYGLVASALNKKTVLRVYKLRKRNPKKPVIVLISSKFEVRMFGVHLEPRTATMLNKVWPDKVSVILPTISKKFAYIHRGTNAIAFRMPADKKLRALLKKTGPLVAPSANFEGEPPARTIREAQDYFGDKADFYVDGGRLAGKPSTLAKIENGKVIVLRKGAVKI